MKKAVGIIAEYNPFHNGHAYQIKKAKERTNADYAVVLMSGDFVQRGTPAVFSKHRRAYMALLGGADVVLELPPSYACSSAETFAAGGVGILDNLNCVDFLCFGSESKNLSPLLTLAEILYQEPVQYQAFLRQALKSGISFPAARKAALEKYCSQNCPALEKPVDTACLDTPNNILGIEYCKALLARNSSIVPVALERKGSGYHDLDLQTYASASAIRKHLLAPAKTAAAADVLFHTQPAEVAAYTQNLLSGEPALSEEDFSLLLKYRLMCGSAESICQYADMSLELSRRIYKKLPAFTSFSQFAQLLKTRELTHTRINRALLHVLLEMPASMPKAAPAYVRLLGFRKESSPFLRSLQHCSSIPLLTKAADYRKRLPSSAALVFEKETFISDLYETVKSARNQTAFVSDLQKPPVIF